MKKLIISVLLAVLFILSAGVVNAEEKKAGDEKLDPSKVLGPETIFGRDRRPTHRTDRHNRRNRTKKLRDQLQRVDKGIRIRLSEHKKFIDELVSIKKLAIKEKAKKTAKRIEKLIEARNAEFAESVKKLNESRDRYREMLVPPGSKPAERQKPAEVTTKPAKQENKEDAKEEKEEKEDKDKWWQFWK